VRLLADVRKVVRELVAKKTIEMMTAIAMTAMMSAVLDKSLAFFALKKLDHARSFHGAAAAAMVANRLVAC